MTKNEFRLQMKYIMSLQEFLCILPRIHNIWLFLVRHFAMTFHRLMVVWLPLTLRTFSIYQQCQKMGRSITVLRREKWSRKYHEYWIVCAISLQTYFAILKRFWPTFLHFKCFLSKTFIKMWTFKKNFFSSTNLGTVFTYLLIYHLSFVMMLTFWKF